MALKPITLRLDEEEYEKLREHLASFGDPDINVAYVLRAYIRDLNRVLPYLPKSEWDLKNYFGLVGFWLRQFVSMTDVEMVTKMMGQWPLWFPGTKSAGPGPADRAEQPEKKKRKHSGGEEAGEK
ncbi:MAG TPA: hypothetical protein VN260_03075 [Dissulfurispiraceae bacterium]|nr:hypothetical protein [Dissulfurispiraceae bacterium]